MYKKAIAILTSFLLSAFPVSILNVNAVEEENVDNIFIMNYDYNGEIVNSVLSIDGDVCVGGFEASLYYTASIKLAGRQPACILSSCLRRNSAQKSAHYYSVNTP